MKSYFKRFLTVILTTALLIGSFSSKGTNYYS